MSTLEVKKVHFKRFPDGIDEFAIEAVANGTHEN